MQSKSNAAYFSDTIMAPEIARKVLLAFEEAEEPASSPSALSL